MDQISRFNLVHRLEKRALLIAVNCVAGLAIFFFGYDQVCFFRKTKFVNNGRV